MQTRFLDAVKAFEGFAEKSSWDYAQHTNGFGTKALYPGEKISLEEANRRFLSEIDEARKFVDAHAQGWDEGTKAALTSLTFNAGTRWASSGLGEAVRNLDIDAVRSRFLQYTKAGGEDLPGLVKRRLAEVTWIGEEAAAMPRSDSPQPAQGRTAADTVAPASSAVASKHVVPAAETNLPVPSAHSESLAAEGAAATQRASSVAWMLLALDIGAFEPGLADGRDRESKATS